MWLVLVMAEIYYPITEYRTASNLMLDFRLQALGSLSTTKETAPDRTAA